MKKILLTLGLLLVFVLGFAFKPKTEVKEITFYKGSLKEAMMKAKSEKKLIFLDVYAVWCGPCKALKATTFKEPDVADHFNKNFVSLEINGEDNVGKEIVKKYGLIGYPYLVFIDANGTLIKKSLGYYDGKQLLEIVHTIK